MLQKNVGNIRNVTFSKSQCYWGILYILLVILDNRLTDCLINLPKLLMQLIKCKLSQTELINDCIHSADIEISFMTQHGIYYLLYSVQTPKTTFLVSCEIA